MTKLHWQEESRVLHAFEWKLHKIKKKKTQDFLYGEYLLRKHRFLCPVLLLLNTKVLSCDVERFPNSVLNDDNNTLWWHAKMALFLRTRWTSEMLNKSYKHLSQPRFILIAWSFKRRNCHAIRIYHQISFHQAS